MRKGGGEQGIKNIRGQETVKSEKKLEKAQKRTRILRLKESEIFYKETKLINGGKFQIIKCADFAVERTTMNH